MGLGGVLIILRPGFEAFDPLSIWAVAGMLGLACRDIAVRRVPAGVHSLQLAFLAFLVLIPTGIGLLLMADATFVSPTPATTIYAAFAVILGVVAYYALLLATRLGEVSFVTPFRYTRIVFGLAVGVTVFSERPDAAMLIGSVIIVMSGLYTLWRERQAT